MSQEILNLFKDAGALQEGHFLLTSGLHSPVYWEKFRILQYPTHTEKLCKMIADHYKNCNIDVVAGPTTGGIILAFEVARHLKIRAIFAEKEGNRRNFRRGLSLSSSNRVLVVDDVLTTGGSVKEVINAVNEYNATLIGIGVLVDRTQGNLKFSVPLYSCLSTNSITYSPDDCPLCRSGIQLAKPGGGS